MKTHDLCLIIFLRKLCRLWDNVEKYDAGRGPTNDNTIWFTSVPCYRSKATRAQAHAYAWAHTHTRTRTHASIHMRTHAGICNTYCFFTATIVSWKHLTHCYLISTLPVWFIVFSLLFELWFHLGILEQLTNFGNGAFADACQIIDRILYQPWIWIEKCDVLSTKSNI